MAVGEAVRSVRNDARASGLRMDVRITEGVQELRVFVYLRRRNALSWAGLWSVNRKGDTRGPHGRKFGTQPDEGRSPPRRRGKGKK